MHVVLDTNQYFRDFYMEGPEFQGLFSYLKKTDSKLIIPTIVKEEIKKNYKEQLSKSYAGINSFQKLTKGAIGKIKSMEESEKAFTDFFEKNINSNSCIVEIGHDNIKLDSIISRVLEELPPFGKKDSGFKDALIWETILIAGKNFKNTPIAFISSNSRDFGKDDLLPDLVQELKNINQNIEYYDELRTFLTDYADKLNFFTSDYINKNISMDDIEKVLPNLSASNIFINKEDIYSFSYPEFEIEIEAWSYSSHEIKEFYIYSATKTKYEAVIEINVSLDVSVWASYYEPVVMEDYISDSEVVQGDTLITFYVEINSKEPHKLSIKNHELWDVV